MSCQRPRSRTSSGASLVSVGGSVQLQVTETEGTPACAEKVKVPLLLLAEQGIALIITLIVCPGVSVPEAGLNATPPRLLAEVQVIDPPDLAVSPSLTLQWKVLLDVPSQRRCTLVWVKLVV